MLEGFFCFKERGGPYKYLGWLIFGGLIFRGGGLYLGGLFGVTFRILQYINSSSFSPKHVLGDSEVGYFVPLYYCTFIYKAYHTASRAYHSTCIYLTNVF